MVARRRDYFACRVPAIVNLLRQARQDAVCVPKYKGKAQQLCPVRPEASRTIQRPTVIMTSFVAPLVTPQLLLARTRTK